MLRNPYPKRVEVDDPLEDWEVNKEYHDEWLSDLFQKETPYTKELNNKLKILKNAFDLINEIVEDDYKIANKIMLDVLNSSLYEVIVEYLKYPRKIDLDFSFVRVPFNFCYELLTEDYFKLNDDYDKNKKKVFDKIVSSSVFFENKLLNDLSEFFDDYDEPIYNVLLGYKHNKGKLENKKELMIKEWLVIGELDLKECFKNTQVYEHGILETALYNKNILDVHTIYEGMEYTPILVNLFKSVEELICDFLGHYKLSIGMYVGSNKKPLELSKFYDEKRKTYVCTYLDEKISNKNIIEAWKEEVTLGTLNLFLYYKINKGEFPIYKGNDDCTAKIRCYDKKYSAYFEKRIEMIKYFNDTYKDKFGLELDIKSEPSEQLFEVIDKWRINCRNNCLHKDDTYSKDYSNKYTAEEKVEMAFDFTMMIIAMLCEWYWCLK